jgi:hypothetical protein
VSVNAFDLTRHTNLQWAFKIDLDELWNLTSCLVPVASKVPRGVDDDVRTVGRKKMSDIDKSPVHYVTLLQLVIWLRSQDFAQFIRRQELNVDTLFAHKLHKSLRHNGFPAARQTCNPDTPAGLMRHFSAQENPRTVSLISSFKNSYS